MHQIAEARVAPKFLHIRVRVELSQNLRRSILQQLQRSFAIAQHFEGDDSLPLAEQPRFPAPSRVPD